jgi:hypothetical protein
VLPTTPEVFDSPLSLHRAFADGLRGLLAQDGLGVFILVRANVAFDPAVGAGLEAELARAFERHSQRLRADLTRGKEPPDAPDDLLVYLKLMAIGREGLEPAQFRRSGPWELQFNPFRALRPRRVAAARLSGMSQPFDPGGFHFNRAFLRKEVFWSGGLLGRPVELLFNKFPFLRLHALLVPEREAEKPQLLTEADHRFIWDLTRALGDKLPGLGIGYNAFGGFASINHLHCQMFLREQPLPVESPQWRHNGGPEAYPASCRVFAGAREGWAYLSRLHAAQISYGLLYRPGRLYCFPRKHQGTYAQPPWTAGFTFYELAGGFTTFDYTDFMGLTRDALEAELRRVDRPC